MEVTLVWCVVAVILILLWFIFRLLYWVWFKPKKIEKLLRKQGLKGTSYKFLFGDLKEMSRMRDEAKSRPINITDDIVPRILPFEHKYVTAYGKNFFTWMGPRPVVHIIEPAIVRNVLANHYHFQKQRGGNPLINFLVTGLVETEGDRWAKHRKIINHAFHVEKLKHMVPACYMCCSENIVDKWEEMLKNKSSCEVDVWPYLSTFSGDVISRTAFGSSFEEGKQIFELQQELAKLIAEVLRSIYIPGSIFLPTKRNKRMKEINREVKSLIRSIIDKKMTALEADEISNDDLLGILLNSNYNEVKQRGNSKLGLSIDEINLVMENLILTG